MNSSNYLVISVIGKLNTDALGCLTRAVHENHCNIEETHMSVMAGTLAVIQLVSGRWNNLAKLESALASLASRLEIRITTQHSEKAADTVNAFTYTVDMVGIDHPGVINNLVDFFTSRGIQIQNLGNTRYTTPHNATPMFSIRMLIDIPEGIHIASIREEFFDLCDAENFDGMMEPLKL